ncbi:SusD/RagB family nutrient-binding outer membrane lipoprotein [Fulvivirga sp. 29W222]|uniref:SusD/RagB family nutrient-binding outer membrane lipoprotein n=1 Tax=Fulvivirga marina TaxID=2494733 RepID=A0A937G325_9BACT|nr:SusD/RagB family nutrient-binding outer membrane lipoprotein [Fulvivirga marina]MBL6449782.1 SusD/RagB family nutrient-binding outer membrane lipoprotein [Fulvivirga marina]
MKKLLYISLIALFFVGCDDRLEELNTDKRNPANVDPTSLFTRAMRESVDMMVSISVNDNPFNLYAQYWAQTTYPDESQYNLTGRSIPRNFWRNGYRESLSNLKNAKLLIQEQVESGAAGVSTEVLQNRIACIDIMTGYVYSVLVDAFGDIPYTEALDPDNLTPAYDDARTVYNSIISNLDAATAAIDAGAAGFPADQDPMYEGEMSKWVLFANSLKFRMGMRLADVDKTASVSIVNAALSAGVFTSNDDNAAMTYYGASPNTSPIYEDLVLSGRQDFVAANTIVDKMNSLGDPRRAIYFRENLGAGTFNGGTYGDANNYSGFTQVGDILHTPELKGVILNYAEVQFLKAEAVERGGYSVSGTAEGYYYAGIEASFDQWDAEGYSSYITHPDVAYASAPGDWKQKIGIQMWLALYNQGFEGWTTWRRLDFTGLNAPPEMAVADIPVRFTYPLEEAQLNGEQYAKAGTAIGGDDVSTKVFWDVL